MRNALIAMVCLFAAGSLFAGTCNDPYVLILGIEGRLSAPCQGAIEFTNASFTPSTLHITKAVDKASPQLMLACMNRKHFHSATLRASATETITFTDVEVILWSQNIDNGIPTETFTLNYGKIEFKYKEQKPDGTTNDRPLSSGSGRTAFMGSAQPMMVKVFVTGISGEGPEEATHFEINVRQGGAQTSSLQLKVKPVAMKAGAVGAATPTTPPTTPSTNGFIELRSAGGAVLSRYQFTGGLRSATGNLRIGNLAPK